MCYLRIAYVAASLLGCAAAASANEPLDPVKAVMEVAVKGKGEYFDPNSLMALYSLAFTRDMVAAMLKTKEKDGEMLLDYDPVIGGQDNCPLKNVTYKQGQQKGKKVTVRVEFSAMGCFGDKSIRRVDFDLVQEGYAVPTQWYFVDDIRHVEKDGKTTMSLRQQLKEMAAN
ncbi:hypothetical protein [Rhizobium sp. FKY42]|uniref:hypothetical protein n=1 Tax=Rhizobium sp. FKY42 TaxID=2562310 RepID=UPI0010C03F54|nr:hypothetical protein [Rhizobium sp. FKY42]